MWIFGFFRFYISVAGGMLFAYLLNHSWWCVLFVTVTLRALIVCGELLVNRIAMDRQFHLHASTFKQELGPYGIRMIKRAENDQRIKKSLSEVFVADKKKLRKAIEQLEMMDTLFKAGMQPDADTWQQHDLKLKYGRFRIAQLEKT